jgi:hypothetical protein
MGNITSLVRGATIEAPGNAMLTYDGLIGKKAVGFPLTLEFILTVTTGVSTGLVANWLYDKIKGRASTLRINRTEVRMSKGEIGRIIIEQIEKMGDMTVGYKILPSVKAHNGYFVIYYGYY